MYLGIIASTPILDSKALLTNIDRVDVCLDREILADIPQGTAFAFTVSWTFSKRRNFLFEWKNQVVYPQAPRGNVRTHSPAAAVIFASIAPEMKK